ncbi:hypothetical protein [Helicobacter rodentium]|uniref:hypothetical protein n=1 Tax=Helicobacter rodentium TaxID=59617 RepID=UPI0023F36440|nr:hypothetical protein [Helicobacter rodentium]
MTIISNLAHFKTPCGSIFELESGFYEPSARSLLDINDEARGEVIADSSQKDNAKSRI